MKSAHQDHQQLVALLLRALSDAKFDEFGSIGLIELILNKEAIAAAQLLCRIWKEFANKSDATAAIHEVFERRVDKALEQLGFEPRFTGALRNARWRSRAELRGRSLKDGLESVSAEKLIVESVDELLSMPAEIEILVPMLMGARGSSAMQFGPDIVLQPIQSEAEGSAIRPNGKVESLVVARIRTSGLPIRTAADQCAAEAAQKLSVLLYTWLAMGKVELRSPYRIVVPHSVRKLGSVRALGSGNVVPISGESGIRIVDQLLRYGLTPTRAGPVMQSEPSLDQIWSDTFSKVAMHAQWELESRQLASASHWAFEADQSQSSIASAVALFVGVEALVGDAGDDQGRGGRGVTAAIADRVSLLLESLPTKRRALRSTVINLMKLRGEIVHGRFSRLGPGQREQISQVRGLLSRLIRNEFLNLQRSLIE